MNREKEASFKSPTRNSIGQLLDATQREYNGLFDDLIILKNFQSEKFNGEIISRFQYKLAACLFRLAESRNQVIAAEKRTVSKKQEFKPNWFNSRMRFLRKMKDSIDITIGIGKSLGDAFVWHFYQLNLSELVGNLEYPEVKFFPTGIGGIGELKFIKNYFFFNGHFSILHGISNFLRIGDVSFFSLKDGKLSSIGEIKTKEIEKNKISVSVNALNAHGRNFLDTDFLKDVKIVDDFDYSEYFDPGRFKRQIKTTGEYLKSKENIIREPDKFVYDKYFVKEFEIAVGGLNKKILNLVKVDESILYAASRLSSKEFSKRTVQPDASNFKKYEPEIERSILSILNQEKPNYQLLTGSVHVDDKMKTRILIGAAPLFWYPIDSKILKQIYFHEVYVMTMFNPTEFLNSLNKLGIEGMKDEHTKKSFLGKKTENGIIRIEHFDYFFSLIQNNLHTPEAVVSLIKEFLYLAENHPGLTNGGKMSGEIFHLFNSYNQDGL